MTARPGGPAANRAGRGPSLSQAVTYRDTGPGPVIPARDSVLPLHSDSESGSDAPPWPTAGGSFSLRHPGQPAAGVIRAPTPALRAGRVRPAGPERRCAPGRVGRHLK